MPLLLRIIKAEGSSKNKDVMEIFVTLQNFTVKAEKKQL